MKTNRKHFPRYWLALVLVMALTAVAGVCSATPALAATSTLTLSSIAVTPASPAYITVYSTQQFIATGTYSDGSTADITSQVTWTTSAPAIATISSGLATGAAGGVTYITASLSGVTSNSVPLTVLAPAPTLFSIAVTPALSGVAIGNTRQFIATVTYWNGVTVDITSQATWTSDPTFATIISGLATGVAAGVTDITAALSGVTSTPASLMVIELDGNPG